MIEKICEWCDTLFTTNDKRRKFCNHACATNKQWSTGKISGGPRVDKPEYRGRHARIARWRGKASAETCVRCNKPAREWAQVHDTDGLDVFADYVAMCVRCHRIYDDNPTMNGCSR